MNRKGIFPLALLTGIVACYIAQVYLPWWIFSVLCFAIAILWKLPSPKQRFRAGFIITFVTWLLLFLRRKMETQSHLDDEIAHLFHLPSGIVLYLVVSAIMGIAGGLASLGAGILMK